MVKVELVRDFDLRNICVKFESDRDIFGGVIAFTRMDGQTDGRTDGGGDDNTLGPYWPRGKNDSVKKPHEEVKPVLLPKSEFSTWPIFKPVH